MGVVIRNLGASIDGPVAERPPGGGGPRVDIRASFVGGRTGRRVIAYRTGVPPSPAGKHLERKGRGLIAGADVCTHDDRKFFKDRF